MHLQRLLLLYVASNSRKKVLEQYATLYQRSDRIFKHLCLWLRNEHGRQFLEEFAPRPVGRNENDTHAFPLVFPTKVKKDRLIAGYPRPGSDVAFHTNVPKCNADKQQQIFPISIKFVVRRDDCTCITKHQYYYPSRGIQTHRILNITTIKEWSLKNFFIPTSYNRWNRAASPEDMRKRKDNNYNEYNNKNINWISFKNALNFISYMPKYLFLSIFLESSVISFYCLSVS